MNASVEPRARTGAPETGASLGGALAGLAGGASTTPPEAHAIACWRDRFRSATAVAPAPARLAIHLAPPLLRKPVRVCGSARRSTVLWRRDY